VVNAVANPKQQGWMIATSSFKVVASIVHAAVVLALTIAGNWQQLQELQQSAAGALPALGIVH